ncbi:MAG: DNA gyrase inhibitor YacG [Polyangiaceae bacterium]|nr:DNA gyrase inhibitor YacG [Polyangiaceae bacterium]
MEAPPGPTCPICSRGIKPRAENAAFPFCSPQCKLVDLGRWLDGTYRVPGPPVESSLGMDSTPGATGRGGEPRDPSPDEEEEE